VAKIKSWKLELTWDDGTVNDVSNYVPVYVSDAIEQFSDYWEERYNDDDYGYDEEEELRSERECNE
jgi:hypothetical protein